MYDSVIYVSCCLKSRKKIETWWIDFGFSNLSDRKCICLFFLTCSSAAGPRIQLPTLARAGTSSFLARIPRASRVCGPNVKMLKPIKTESDARGTLFMTS